MFLSTALNSSSLIIPSPFKSCSAKASSRSLPPDPGKLSLRCWQTSSRVLRAKIRNSVKRRPSAFLPPPTAYEDDCKPWPELNCSSNLSVNSETWRPNICTSASLSKSGGNKSPCRKKSKMRRSSRTSAVVKPSARRYTARNSTNSSYNKSPVPSASTTRSASAIIARRGMKPRELKRALSSVTSMLSLPSSSNLMKISLICWRSNGIYLSMKLTNSSKSK
mmetsp:Transcript_71505/g.207026  ORF Transcript_71505/g.207026 Transcript_71505/m.207026 type:complete len:221 (+) Transcript_71505:1325-1987(+)